MTIYLRSIYIHSQIYGHFHDEEEIKYCYLGNAILHQLDIIDLSNSYSTLLRTGDAIQETWLISFSKIFGINMAYNLYKLIKYLNDDLHLSISQIKDCLTYLFDCYENEMFEYYEKN